MPNDRRADRDRAHPGSSGLAEKRVLLVEDEALAAMLAEDLLAELGVTVVGPAGTVREGRRLAEREALDAAVLDVHLDGERSWPVAATLRARGVPFVFTTGDAGTSFAAGTTVVTKPYRRDDLERALRDVLAAGG